MSMSPPPPIVQNSGQVLPAGHEPANLGDILERVLDRGIVIAGDIRVSLLDIELLTLKLRLVIASVDTARQMGIDWWEHDPFLSSRPRPPVGREPVAREPVRELSDAEPEYGHAEPGYGYAESRPPVRRRRTGDGRPRRSGE